jgi:hypothetical protein
VSNSFPTGSAPNHPSACLLSKNMRARGPHEPKPIAQAPIRAGRKASAYAQSWRQPKSQATCEDVAGCFCRGRLDSRRGCARNRLQHGARPSRGKWGISCRPEQRRNYRPALWYKRLSAEVIQQSDWPNFRPNFAMPQRCNPRCQRDARADRDNSHTQFNQQFVQMTMMHARSKSPPPTGTPQRPQCSRHPR